MKKILILQPFLSYGGAEAVSVQLAFYLKKRGFEAKVMTLYKKRNLPLLADRVEIVSILNLFELCTTDVFNPHNFPTLWIAVVIGKLLKIPVIWTVHNFPQSPFGGGIDKLFAKNCNAIISVSEKVQGQVKEYFNLNSELIHPAVDYDFWTKGKGDFVRKKFGLRDDFIFLQVARLKREKKQELSIKSFAKVIKKIGKAILILVGDGEDKDRLETVAKGEGVYDKTLFVGYQTPETLRDFYAASDLHLLPGHETEGFNLAPLEALCAQTVSIVAEGSGVDVVLKKNDIGLVAKPKAKDFAKEIITAYRNKDKIIKMGKKGKDWVRKNLSWENYIDEFLRLEVFKGV